MEPNNTPAIISAIAGISGVLLGNLFVAVKEWIAGGSRRRSNTVYLAIVVSSHLDRFANGCLTVAMDDGTSEGRPAGGDGEYRPTTKAPTFQPLDLQVEWKALARPLLHDILRLPDRREQLQNQLGGIYEYDSDPPEHAPFFWARRRGYAELGLHAGQLAQKLRKAGKVDLKELMESKSSRDDLLRQMIESVEAEEDAFRQRIMRRQKKTAGKPDPLD